MGKDNNPWSLCHTEQFKWEDAYCFVNLGTKVIRSGCVEGLTNLSPLALHCSCMPSMQRSYNHCSPGGRHSWVGKRSCWLFASSSSSDWRLWAVLEQNTKGLPLPSLPHSRTSFFKREIWKDTCTPCITAALFTEAKTWKQLTCPSTEDWTKNMRYTTSMGFSRQEYWNGLPFPFPGYLLDQGLNMGLQHWQGDSLSLSHQGSLTKELKEH